MTGGSLQLRAYVRLRRAGTPTADAAEAAGIDVGEARAWDDDEASGLLGWVDTSEPAPIGHNSKDKTMTTNVAAEPLRLFIERIERLEEEKKGMADDIRDVYAEAKGQGYDAKTMRAVVRLRKMEKNARDEAQALLETYGSQLGLF